MHGTPSINTSRTAPYGKPACDTSYGFDWSVTILAIVFSAFGPHTPIVQMPCDRSVKVTEPSIGMYLRNQ